jgi:YgiT-type zinc finger domain-containing protein
LREALVKSTFWQDDRLVVAENIPAVVCDSCAERYYDDATSTALDIMQKNDFLLKDTE